GPAGRHEAAADLTRDRGAEDEAPRLRAEDELRCAQLPPPGELVDRVREGYRVGEQRRHVLEADARLGPVRDLADFLGEVHPLMLTQAAAARAGTAAASTPVRAPPAARGPPLLPAAAPDSAIAAPARRSPRSGPPGGRRRSGR